MQNESSYDAVRGIRGRVEKKPTNKSSVDFINCVPRTCSLPIVFGLLSKLILAKKNSKKLFAPW